MVVIVLIFALLASLVIDGDAARGVGKPPVYLNVSYKNVSYRANFGDQTVEEREKVYVWPSFSHGWGDGTFCNIVIRHISHHPLA